MNADERGLHGDSGVGHRRLSVFIGGCIPPPWLVDPFQNH